MNTQKLLLSARNLAVSYGIQTLFAIDRLEIHDGDRIGLVGANGCGKSTLLSLLAGENQQSGDIAGRDSIERRCRIALVRQAAPDVKQAGHAGAAPQLLRTLGVYDTAGKSGGEQTRLALAAAFSQDAPLLLADEPSTNLDFPGLALLENHLRSYRGAFVLVSHDRTLLDAVCTTIWAFSDGGLRVFDGNYTQWNEQRQREHDFAQFAYEQYQTEKNRLQAEIRAVRTQARAMRKPPKRMGNSESRLYKDVAAIQQKHVQSRAKAMESRMMHLEEKKRPEELPQISMALGAGNPIVSKIAARIEGFSKQYGKRVVLKEAAFVLPTGSKTVMLGDNGAGKTTLAHALFCASGQGQTDCVRLAGGVRVGYFSQQHELLNLSHTVLENVRADSAFSEAEVRTVLANLLLPGDAVFKPAGVLSGGERAKTALAKLLCSGCNLLLLDEPTNHIDLYTAEALESLLQSWQGTLLVITHDRRLAEHVADRLLFVDDGHVRTFEGGWQAWEESKKPKLQKAELDTLIEQMRRAADAAR